MQQFLNPCFGPKVNIKDSVGDHGRMFSQWEDDKSCLPALHLHFRIDMYSSLGLRRQLSKHSSTVKVATKYKGQFLSWQIELFTHDRFHRQASKNI